MHKHDFNLQCITTFSHGDKRHINDPKEHATSPHCKHIGFPPKHGFESLDQPENLHELEIPYIFLKITCNYFLNVITPK